MAQKDKIAIDITGEKISIIIGTRFKILNAITIETPKEAYSDDKITDIEALRSAMEPHIGKAKHKDAYFIVRGDDLIVRRITLPIMKEAAMRESVEWELTQFVGERADEYNVSYEVSVRKDSTKDGNCEVLMVAVEKTKTNRYLELGKALGLNLKGLDICSSATSRILRSYQQLYTTGIKSVGVIDIGANSSSISIVERGKMMLEKYQGYGMMSASNNLIESNMEYEVFLDKIDLVNEDAEDFTDGKLERLFDSINNQFNTIIQFYSSGKVKKSLDKMFLLGSASKVKGLDKYLESVFNTQVEHVPSFDNFRFSIKVGKKIQLKDYFYVYGLLLRSDGKELNLLPVEYNSREVSGKQKKSAILIVAALVVVLLGGFGYVQGKRLVLTMSQKSLVEEIAKNKEIIEKEAVLDRNIAMLNAHIQKAGTLGELKTKETDKIILEMQKYFPSNVKAVNVNYNRNSINVSATSTNQESIEQLWANLRETEIYKNCHIGGIAGKDGVYTFTIQVTLGGGVEVGNS
ncbi:MAG: pilus assembly protein PilM [Clostridium sp.]